MIGWSLLAASSLSAGAVAPVPETRDDLRCFLIMALLVDSSAEGKGKEAAMAGTLYFLGKLDVRAPGLDIGAAATAELGSMTEAEFQSQKPRCIALLEERGHYLVAIGTAMEKRGKPIR
jgi:hypothetical protein